MLIPSCATEVKAQAIRWALMLAKEHSKCRIIIEGYCKICLDALNKKDSKPSWELFSLIEDNLALSKQLFVSGLANIHLYILFHF